MGLLSSCVVIHELVVLMCSHGCLCSFVFFCGLVLVSSRTCMSEKLYDALCMSDYLVTDLVSLFVSI